MPIARRLALTSPLAATLLLAGTQSACVDMRSDAQSDAARPGATRLLWTDPPSAGADPPPTHPRNAPVLLCFSDYLAPSSVDPGVVSMSSGGRNYDSTLRFALADWRQSNRTCPGSLIQVSPPETLDPGAQYRLRVVDRLRDWEGRPLSSQDDPRWIEREQGRVLLIEFRTDERLVPPISSQAPLRFTDLFEAGAVFGPQSPSCSCHQAPGSFDLRDPKALYTKLRFGQRGANLPWIYPGHPSRSYLIYKLLRTPQGMALPGVAGDPMPPNGPVRAKDLAQIARWIEDGALP